MRKSKPRAQNFQAKYYTVKASREKELVFDYWSKTEARATVSRSRSIVAAKEASAIEAWATGNAQWSHGVILGPTKWSNAPSRMSRFVDY